LFRGEPVSARDIHTRVATQSPVDPFTLSPDKRVSLTVATTDTPATTRNVVAVLRGSHPTLRDEYVALGAHYDHLGLATGVTEGDAIYNGADDDGSGTVGLLGMAEAFATTRVRPKRSLLFVWHAGEEIGLWGARYFSERPTVPLDRIVTQINVDMIGRSRAPGDASPANAALTGPDAVYVIGSRLMSTELGTLVDQVNARYLKLTYDFGYADPNHPDRFFYRSDHYHYARQGIPVVFFFTGVHEDYHGVGDHVDKIDFRKMTRIARTIYATAWAVAELPKRPLVDTPLGRELLTR
jgi:Zn-dependent M28 family amino/carboxypeptidase